jgi:hypothetical protein
MLTGSDNRLTLSRRKQGYESPRERQSLFVHLDFSSVFGFFPNYAAWFGQVCSRSVLQALRHGHVRALGHVRFVPIVDIASLIRSLYRRGQVLEW